MSTYSQMKKLEIIKFENDIYIDEDLSDYKEGFLTGIMAIIEEQLPEAYRKDFIEFMLG